MKALIDAGGSKTECELPPALPAAWSIRLAAWLVCAVVLMMLHPAPAALLLYEPFSTTAFPADDTKLGRVSGQWNLGNNTDANGGWSMVRSAAALSYSSLVTSNGSRGVARIPNTYPASRNIGAPWTTAVTSGSVYCSCLVNVTAAPQTNRALLVLSFFSSGNISGRNDGCGAVLWLNASRQLQLGKYSTSAMAPGTTPALDLGVTCLVVLKYTFNPSSGDDLVALYLDPVTTDPEPGSPTIWTTAGTDSSQMKSVWLPQSQSPEFGSYTGDVLMDEIRVGDAWADVLPSDGPPPTIREPYITEVYVAEGHLVLNGTNGSPHGAYEALRTTDLAQPAGDWPGVGGIRSFDASGNFSFTNALPADAAGFYRLHVVSSVPVYPPALTLQPQDVAIAVGQNATFSVTATGTAPLTCFWYFNTNTLLAGGPNVSLTVTNAQLGDAGKYSVTVTNIAGTTHSAFATLTVTNSTQPPFIVMQPASLNVVTGQTASFTVSATGAPPLNYQWHYNTNTPLAGGTNATLNITNAQPTDAGTYSVTVTNLYGATPSTLATLTVSEQAARVKPRIIATTDGEVDDRSSMVRFLMYSCDFDVVGIVQVNSRYQTSGHSGDHWVEAELDRYEQVRTNLIKHNPDYPTANYLRSVVRVGNENKADLWVSPPDMATKNTAGEQLIIQTLLDDDPRPVHVPSWGGANTTASALWRLKYSGEYTTEQFNKAVSRIRIYCIWYQDGGGYYIQTNITEAYINEAYRWDNVWDYQSVGGVSPTDYTGSDAYLIFPAGSENTNNIQYYMTGDWLTNNVKTGHGPLGAYTPQKYISEGDTPSFLHLINNGLEAQEDYTLGGWGGRSAYDNPTTYPNHLKDRSPDIYDDGNVNKMYWRWIPAAQNDFAARMDWCVATSYAGANHPPVARVNGSLHRDAAPGQAVSLDATSSTDPDGHSLVFNWWQYCDADSSTNRITIANSSSMNNASFVVPGATNQIGKQIHVILQVTDNGTPPLTGYQRIICTIK